LKLTAGKSPDADSGNQSSEPLAPFTLSTTQLELAVHTRFTGRFLHAGHWLKQKRVSGSWLMRTTNSHSVRHQQEEYLQKTPIHSQPPGMHPVLAAADNHFHQQWHKRAREWKTPCSRSIVNLVATRLPHIRVNLVIRGGNKSSKKVRFFPQSVFSPRGNVINSCP
jgi:hypothetical protein